MRTGRLYPSISESSAARISAAGSSTPSFGRPGASSSTSRGTPPTTFLSRASAAQASSRSTRTGSGRSSLLDRRRVETREAERGEQPERDRSAVRQLEAGRRLERVRERVTQVQLCALPAVVWVAQADRRLERGRAPHLLGERQLPQRLTCQQPCLHDLRAPVRELDLRQRLQRRRVDHGSHRPVEGADEVLRIRKVDGGLAADRGVHLADERGRHGDPVDPAEVSRGRKAGDVGRAAAAECDERSASLEPQRVPEPPRSTRRSSPPPPARAHGSPGRGRRARAARPCRRSRRPAGR